MRDDIIYGINSVKALLEHKPHLILEIYCKKGLNPRLKELMDLANNLNISCQPLSDKWQQSLNASVHQGVIARVSSISLLTEDFLDDLLAHNKNPLILFLDSITDPQNFGAILRSAEIFQVDCVVIPQHNSVKVTPVVRKVASGAAELLNIVTVVNLTRTINKLKQLGLWIVGASNAIGAVTLSEYDFSGPTGIVLGAEGDGIRDLVAKSCDAMIKIPQWGNIESLNVSVAAGIILYEAKKARI